MRNGPPARTPFEVWIERKRDQTVRTLRSLFQDLLQKNPWLERQWDFTVRTSRALYQDLLRQFPWLADFVDEVRSRVHASPMTIRVARGLLLAAFVLLVASSVAGAAASVPFRSSMSRAVNGGEVQITDRNGEMLYTFAGPEGGFRIPVALDQISPNLVNATVATEDADFYTNPGVNFRGLLRAFYENVAFWNTGGLLRGTGGSSITQQVVKNLHVYETSPTRTPITKVREIIGALTLARLHSK
ncbi:MAG TPA: transglycosylase domain-containing protein, partial [Chloroflexota bacterium]